MRSLRPAILLIAGLGLTGCVGVSDGYGGQPYGSTFSGNTGFVTPYSYRGGSSGYLYDQSQRTWQGNNYRPPPNYIRPNQNYRPNVGRPRNNNYYRHNPPGHNNPPGRGNGHDND